MSPKNADHPVAQSKGNTMHRTSEIRFHSSRWLPLFPCPAIMLFLCPNRKTTIRWKFSLFRPPKKMLYHCVYAKDAKVHCNRAMPCDCSMPYFWTNKVGISIACSFFCVIIFNEFKQKWHLSNLRSFENARKGNRGIISEEDIRICHFWKIYHSTKLFICSDVLPATPWIWANREAANPRDFREIDIDISFSGRVPFCVLRIFKSTHHALTTNTVQISQAV